MAESVGKQLEELIAQIGEKLQHHNELPQTIQIPQTIR
jgi:hypothetical protein